ncbi:hypothetical protein DFH08DRAFT_1080040 [Mycena albidolilacea]|uniref:Uncharacterized protein n=1 Tax=Mycena albidolilacea TaxID=1033008 RepID=A0AAD7A1J6_9AGAR|nr:hypothetical protein DFH08DRAFT_1080040 [Mycena albidolilacea]
MAHSEVTLIELQRVSRARGIAEGDETVSLVTAGEFLAMILTTLLFNPLIRVWNLRFLLLWTLGIIGYEIWSKSVNQFVIIVCGLLLLHHVLGVGGWRFKGLAAADLGLTLGEIATLGWATYSYEHEVSAYKFFPAIVTPGLVTLSLSAVFRISTIKIADEPILHQRLLFLGGCARTHPPYTALSVLLNRSIARPLVRGEGRYIIVMRAFVLSLVGISVPAFAIYSIFITPLSTQIYKRDLSDPYTYTLPGNATVLLDLFQQNISPNFSSLAGSNIQMHVVTNHFKFNATSESSDGIVLECESDLVLPGVVEWIATFGGFWTFLNGAFALFFGANVLYFMFGRRPLSALGVVHILQRRRLVRQWHEDFPAVHTEGGLPGSESAGIVAFIRERLVDLGEDPRKTEAPQADVEAQTSKDDQEIDTDDSSSLILPVVHTPEPSGIYPPRNI